MKLAVVGDTHGKIKRILDQLRLIKPDYLAFTGDYYQDGQRLARELKLPYTGVAGNCDHSLRGSAEKKVEIKGFKFLIVHGHQYGVKSSLNRIFYRGQELGVNAILFGHTHVPCCEIIEGMWLLNPGSPTYPRLGEKGSYAVVDIKESHLEPAIIRL
jgi:putative phosphoesterase